LGFGGIVVNDEEFEREISLPIILGRMLDRTTVRAKIESTMIGAANLEFW
jgi:hypothetical protein